MTSCKDFIHKLLEENPNLTDKEVISKMKDLKDEKGKRMYKVSTITSKLRQVKAQLILPDESSKGASEGEGVNLNDAKKEVEEAFGKGNKMKNNAKSVEPRETESGHKVFDGRIEPTSEEIDKVIDKSQKQIGSDIPEQGFALKEFASQLKRYELILSSIDKKIDVMGKEVLQLKQGGLPVADELVDVQLRESVIGKLDAVKEDVMSDDNPAPDLSDAVEYLLEKKDEVKDRISGFLEKISLDKDGSVHGKFIMHDNQWRFFKRAKPIIYAIAGAGVACLSLFVLLALLRALNVLPGWI